MPFNIHECMHGVPGIKKSEMLIRYCIVVVITALVHASSASSLIVDRSVDDFRFVAYHDLLTTARRFSDHNVTTYSRLLFDVGRNAVILGARNRIYRLSMQLDLMQRIEWEAPASVIEICLAKGQNEADCQNYIMAIHQYKDKLLICGSYAYSPKCSWRTIDTLSVIKEESSGGRSPFNPHSNVTTLVTEDGKMFVGSTIDFSSSDSAILRADLSTTQNSKSLRTKQYNDIELYDPQFVGSFEHGDYVYFVFREISIEMASFGGAKAIYSRIARVCKNDAGGVHILRENWTSFYKARLNCSLPGGDFPFYFDEVQGISYSADEGELYATFTTPENSIRGSAICVFNISAIERAFSGPIKYQEVSGSSNWQIKQQTGNFACGNQRSSSNLMDSSKYKLMSNAIQAMHLSPLYVEQLEVFTHISVTKVSTKLFENVPIIFVTNNEGFIKKISILPRTKQSCLIEVLEPENRRMHIESMEFVKASESLYIGTKNSLLQIPSQRCSRHISRVSCLNSMDPYCGWNDLMQKCSMAPNGDPLLSHWYQNATTCPILSTPVDGSFSAWSQWFKCAKSGDGDPITGNELSSNIDTCLCRTRTCDNPSPKNGGKSCAGHTIMVTNCTVNGGWSEWSSYGQCSQSCGVAIKVRRRTCTSPKAAFGGRTCVGVDRQEIYCTDLPPCPPPVPFNLQIDGGWGPWGDWGECSSACGGGYRIRNRKCDDPAPMNGGVECIGCNVEYELCNKQPCSEVKKVGPFTPWLIVNNSDVGYLEKRFRYQCKATLPDPASLKISLLKEETRTCSHDGGCHRMNEVSQKAAYWGCWTDYSACSVSCGIGRRVRYRKCMAHGGEVVSDKECEGSSVQDETCEMPSCDSLIGWGEWSDWSPCNDENEKSRYRQCKVLNPSAKECIGDERETRICSLNFKHEKIVMTSSLAMHWIVIIFLFFGLFCAGIAFFAAKYTLERKMNRLRRIQGSPHYMPSFPNQYSSLPMKDFVDNKPKRQPSFSGSTSHSKLTNGHGTLTKSNNNLLNQNTPKILKFQNDTDSSTLKRNSALNNMRLKQIDDDMEKY